MDKGKGLSDFLIYVRRSSYAPEPSLPLGNLLKVSLEGVVLRGAKRRLEGG